MLSTGSCQNLEVDFFLPGTPYTQTVNMVFHGFLWLSDGLTEKGLTDTAGSCGCQMEVSWNGCTPKSSIFWILHFRKLLNLANELFPGRRNGYTTKATTCHGRSSLTLGCRFTKSRDVTRAKLFDLGQWSPLDDILLGYIGIDGSTMTSTLIFFNATNCCDFTSLCPFHSLHNPSYYLLVLPAASDVLRVFASVCQLYLRFDCPVAIRIHLTISPPFSWGVSKGGVQQKLKTFNI